MSKDIDRERYENLKKRSKNASKGHKKKDYKIQMRLSDYVKSLKIVGGACVISTLLAIGVGHQMIDNIKDAMVINSLVQDFNSEVIQPEAHRTNDNKNYFYDYQDIANYLNKMDDFDTGVYLLNSNIGDYQTGLVLGYTSYDSFTHYKEVKGYESTEDFRDNVRKKILLTEDIKEKEQELADMNSERNNEIESIEIGNGGQK